MSVTDDERAAATGERAGELDDAVVYELDAPVGAIGKCVEDLAVEHERAEDARERCERAVERGVIEIAQIATEPHQCAFATI
jgi:hypothetical protein